MNIDFVLLFGNELLVVKLPNATLNFVHKLNACPCYTYVMVIIGHPLDHRRLT